MALTSTDDAVAAEVIIIGAGPVGLTLANLLGVYGVSAIVLERDQEYPNSPRAVGLDDESLRIWQQCGLLKELEPFLLEGEEQQVVFTVRDKSEKILFEMQQRGRPFGHARGNLFLYHRALEVLRRGVGRFTQVHLRVEHAVDQFCQETDRVLVGGTSRDGRFVFSGRYAVACDGGRSTARQVLNIPMKSWGEPSSWLILDTLNSDQAETRPAAGVEVWCDRSHPAATIPLPGGYRRWEFKLKAGDDPELLLKDEPIAARMSARGFKEHTRIERRLVHTYKACLARQYRCSRIFLAGDAAHLSPPFAGQGLATGLRDASNLGWKLAAVLRGRQAAELLSSYEVERRPHQRRMLKLAVRMGRVFFPESAWLEELSRLTLRLTRGARWLHRILEIRGKKVVPRYRGTAAARGPLAGRLLPQPPVGAGKLDDLLGAGYAVIGVGIHPREALSPQEVERLKLLEPVWVAVLDHEPFSEAYHALCNWSGGKQKRILVVRPDRYVEQDLI